MEQASEVELPTMGFESLGPTVRSALVASKRRVNFIDEGPPSGVPLVFLGGAGTTVRAFKLMEFARPFREYLGIRIVSVERNGLGQTSFDPGVGVDEYAEDVWSLLDQLGIGSASIVAVSGGGPYAAYLAAAHPERVRSLHLACAYAESIPGSPLGFDAGKVAADPVAWWLFGPESAVHQIPGFIDSAIEEATRAMFARGRNVEPEGLRQAFDLYAEAPLPELGDITSPVFMYWGSEDALVPTDHMERWQRSLNSRKHAPKIRVRMYEGEGHDVQYRHWDQILTDVAYLGTKVLVWANGKNLLVDSRQSERLLEEGAHLGLAGWHTGRQVGSA